MKKNLRIIQINGFRGLFITLFVVSCLIAGFIAFPAFLSMNLWNLLAVKTASFPLINFYEGVLLWGIIILSIFTFCKKKFIVSFDTQQELNENELKNVVSKIKELNENKYTKNEEIREEEVKK